MTPDEHALDQAPIDGDRHTVGFIALMHRAGIVFVVQVVGAGVTYLLQILLARLLGAADYGTYTYVFVFVTISSLVAGGGFPAASIRFLPEYRVKNDWARFHGFLRTTTLATVGISAVFAAAVIGIAAILAALDVLDSPSPVILGAVLVPAFAISVLYTEVARAMGWVGVAYVPSLVVRPLLIGAFAGGLSVVSGSISAVPALVVSIVAAYLVAAVQYGATSRLLRSVRSAGERIVEFRQWLGVGTTLLAASTFTIILLQADIVIVALLRGPEEAGLYAAAAKTATLVAFIILAVNAAAAPQFTSLWTQGRKADLQRLTARLAGVIFWPSLIISVGLAVLSNPILSLFGPEFPAAQLALILLLVGQVVNAAAGSVGYLLVLTGHHREATRVLGISATACVLLSVVGVLALGFVGAAIGSMVGFVIWNAWLYVLVVQKLGIHASVFSGPDSR